MFTLYFFFYFIRSILFSRSKILIKPTQKKVREQQVCRRRRHLPTNSTRPTCPRVAVSTRACIIRRDATTPRPTWAVSSTTTRTGWTGRVRSWGACSWRTRTTWPSASATTATLVEIYFFQILSKHLLWCIWLLYWILFTEKRESRLQSNVDQTKKSIKLQMSSVDYTPTATHASSDKSSTIGSKFKSRFLGKVR